MKRLGKLVVISMLLFVSACAGPNIQISKPGELPSAANAPVRGSSAIVSAYADVAADYQVMHASRADLYRTQAKTGEYKKYIVQTGDVQKGYRQLAEHAALLYKLCDGSSVAQIRDAGVVFAATALKMAEARSAFYHVTYGYSHAGDEMNLSYLKSETEAYANRVQKEGDLLEEQFLSRAAAFSNVLKNTSGQAIDSQVQPRLYEKNTMASVLVANAPNPESQALVQRALTNSAASTALAHSPDVKVAVSLKKFEESSTLGTGDYVLTAFVGPLNTRWWGRGGSSFDAVLVMPGREPISLASPYEILARDPGVQASMIGAWVADRAHFELLKRQIGMP